jgi:hypothetical protein
MKGSELRDKVCELGRKIYLVCRLEPRDIRKGKLDVLDSLPESSRTIIQTLNVYAFGSGR